MKSLLVMLGLGMTLAWGIPDDDAQPAPTNVNSRYTVESVSVSGWKNRLISAPLRTELDQVVGQKLDHSRLESLASRIKKELHVSDVNIKVTKGTMPDSVLVNFEVARHEEHKFNLSLGKFLYDSKQGWSGAGTAGFSTHGNGFAFGLVSDGDSLAERFAGIRARYTRENLGTDRLGLKFDFESYHEQWNRSTLAVAEPFEIYRTRQVFNPEAKLILAEPLELDFGVRFARYRLSTPGAITESSNAVVSTLRYHQRWGSAGDAYQQELDASYSLEVATHVLESDPAYTRQTANARYKVRHGHNSVQLSFLAGHIRGLAPLFDRFVLGNTSTLRGWNKFDLDPRGGSRVVHGAIDYSYRFFQIFYDTGAIWDRPQDKEQKQSIGTGFKKAGFQLAVAFPLRSGHGDPIFFAGMNF